MSTVSMNPWARRLTILFLFAALVVALLWFQGIVLRDEHPPSEVPPPPALTSNDTVFRAERRVLTDVQVHPGFVAAIDPADVAPRVMATILEVAGREGDPVAAGRTVVALDDRDVRAGLSQAESALQAASARALQARLAFDRAQRLLDAEALTTQEWEAARATRDGAVADEERAREAVAEARTALSWFRLEAPFEGRILERHADPGSLATPGKAILSLYREDRLRFEVAVPEERAAELVVGAALEVELGAPPPGGRGGAPRANGVDGDGGAEVRTCLLTRVLPAADPATGTVTLHLELDDGAGLRPGQLGRLRLGVGEREALVVPLAAIERIGQVERVGLVRDGRVVPATVRTGKVHGALVEVLSGLGEGDEVRVP